jgi:hypothetical protein
MKRIDSGIVRGTVREINEETYNELIYKTTVVPTSFIKKGRSEIIRQVNVKTPKEILAQMTEDITNMTDEKIIKMAKGIVKSGADMIKASNNEENITFCKKFISHMPKDSYTYYYILREELIPYLNNEGILERAISIALKELVQEGNLEKIDFYVYGKKINGYKVK